MGVGQFTNSVSVMSDLDIELNLHEDDIEKGKEVYAQHWKTINIDRESEIAIVLTEDDKVSLVTTTIDITLDREDFLLLMAKLLEIDWKAII